MGLGRPESSEVVPAGAARVLLASGRIVLLVGEIEARLDAVYLDFQGGDGAFVNCSSGLSEFA
jgi:hypothetical protein